MRPAQAHLSRQAEPGRTQGLRPFPSHTRCELVGLSPSTGSACHSDRREPTCTDRRERCCQQHTSDYCRERAHRDDRDIARRHSYVTFRRVPSITVEIRVGSAASSRKSGRAAYQPSHRLTMLGPFRPAPAPRRDRISTGTCVIGCRSAVHRHREYRPVASPERVAALNAARADSPSRPP